MSYLQVFASHRQISMLAAFLMCALLSVGCGGSSDSDEPRGDVTISISYGGEPVPEGMINLIGEKGGNDKGGDLSKEGIATISGLALGKYKVTVVPPMLDPAPPEPGKPAPKMKEYPNIPKKFRQPKTSPLTIEISEESRDLKFDLKDEN